MLQVFMYYISIIRRFLDVNYLKPTIQVCFGNVIFREDQAIIGKIGSACFQTLV